MEQGTAQQRRILYLLAQGLRQNEIPAYGVNLSFRTVETYLLNLRRSLDARTTLEAAVKLWLAGALPLDALLTPTPRRRDLTFLHRLSLARVAAGWSYEEIRQRQAYTATNAVRAHLSEARKRLNGRTLHQTVFLALKWGLLTAREIQTAAREHHGLE